MIDIINLLLLTYLVCCEVKKQYQVNRDGKLFYKNIQNMFDAMDKPYEHE